MSTIEPDVKKRTRYVTGTNIFTLYRCEHALYLDFFGDPAKKRKPDDALKLLFRKGNEHEAVIASRLAYPEPEYEMTDWDSGLGATLELMKAGVPGIYQAVLKNDRYLGKPDLMRRVEVPSELGVWSYEIGDIKSSKKVKAEQVMQVAFYSYLLEQLQGVRPNKGFIILADESEEEFLVDDYHWTLLDCLDEIEEIISGDRTTFYQISSACDSCLWNDCCLETALAENDISLIFGLTRNQKKLLANRGITTIADVAKLKVKELATVKGLGQTSLTRMKKQAQVMLQGKQLVLQPAVLPDCDTALYFDMESDPYSETEYLFGTMLVAGDQDPVFRYFLAKSPDEEESAFSEFMEYIDDLLRTYGPIPIYHYHHYERTHTDKLAGRYGQVQLLALAQENMVDLLPIVKGCVVLPLPSYSLKDVARYVGFEWRGEDASASQSVVWYNNYLEDGEERWIDLIIEYNQDDLVATRKVHQWLTSL
ncbi:MAG: TM0106 family RecB-like putative nuclease [Candidatus Geothermincolia bacterium]